MTIQVATLAVMFVAAAVLVAIATIALIVAAITGRVNLRSCCEPISLTDAVAGKEQPAAATKLTQSFNGPQ